jgi:N-acetylglutamate synthase-like GNAT family acetyltransferase
VEIVPLADRDEFLRELADLHHAEWNHLSPSRTVEGRAKAIKNSAGREGIPSIFIAVSEDQLLGSAAIVKHDMDDKPHLSPWLAAVYVKSEYRNEGIATELISHCEAETARLGFSKWYLCTEFGSKFYENLGWKHLECAEHEGVEISVMYKDL